MYIITGNVAALNFAVAVALNFTVAIALNFTVAVALHFIVAVAAGIATFASGDAHLRPRIGITLLPSNLHGRKLTVLSDQPL